MCYVLACLYQSYLVNVRTFCSACSAKGDCDQSYALPYNYNPRTRFTAPLCQACKAVITRHVVSVGQTATGASSRSGLIIAGDSIASYSWRMLWGNARNAIPLAEESESTQQSTLTLRTIYADGKGSHKLCNVFRTLTHPSRSLFPSVLRHVLSRTDPRSSPGMCSMLSESFPISFGNRYLKHLNNFSETPFPPRATTFPTSSSISLILPSRLVLLRTVHEAWW